METETTHNRDGSINAALTTGIIGTAGTLLGALGTGAGLLGNRGNSSSNNYITKDEFIMGQQLASKDCEIALLKSESNTEQKMVDVYKETTS